MNIYQALMGEWLEVMGDMVQEADSDGMEFYFTHSLKRFEARSWEGVVDELYWQRQFRENRGRPGITRWSEIPRLIKQILEVYQNRLTETHNVKSFSGVESLPKKGPRKMSMYVLTDGEWDTQSDLENQIRTLVDRLCKNDKRHKQVAIQFLRFGNSPRGIEHLDNLERGFDLEL